jgi:hypothetical protein
VQYVRTNGIKARILQGGQRFPDVNLEKIWNVLSHIFATNIGLSLYLERQNLRMVLLKNQTQKELITGDQPVINIRAKALDTNPPDDVELYYPVSPYQAIMITKRLEKSPLDKILMNDTDVDKYNAMIASHSFEQIFAASKEALLVLSC